MKHKSLPCWFIWGNIIFAFLEAVMVHIVEIHPSGRRGPFNPTLPTWWLMMNWQNKEVTHGFPAQRPVMWSLMFSLICTWTNAWANNRDIGDLRCNQAHYDVTVMIYASMNNVNIQVQVMACCLFSTKSLYKPMVTYSEMGHEQQISVNLNQNTNIFYIKKW